tara:strand:- start:48 stop:947 length:900 start_codon:yes stop_codon:yes gene_type:complete
MNKFWGWRNHQVSWHSQGVKKDNQVAIVLIHGFGASKDHWRFNDKVIGSITSCYAIDLVGFGASSKPKSKLEYEKIDVDAFNYCFDKWSEQIIDFCNQIVNKPVILIGNSIGGLIALNASEKIAKGCLGLILINCAQRTMDDKRLSEQSLFMRFIRPVIKTLVRQRFLSSILFKNAANPTFIQKILKVAYPSGNNIDKQLIDILFKPTQSKGAPEAFRGFINLFDDHLAPDLLQKLKIPTYLIWGEKDPWEPLNDAQKWVKNYKCIKSLDIIQDAGHCPHDEMPEKVNPILIKIIQEAI